MMVLLCSSSPIGPLKPWVFMTWFHDTGTCEVANMGDGTRGGPGAFGIASSSDFSFGLIDLDLFEYLVSPVI